MTCRPLLAALMALAVAGCAPAAGINSTLDPTTTIQASSPELGLPADPPVGDPHTPMPALGTCHIGERNGQPVPDPTCTPGATNPAVTQATVGQTICVAGWTKTVRPPTSKSNRWKREIAAAYGVTFAPNRDELDHHISLQLGGSPDDPRNLWIEPGPIPNIKDPVESWLKREVCAERMTLAAAQEGIAGDWTQYLRVADGHADEDA